MMDTRPNKYMKKLDWNRFVTFWPTPQKPWASAKHDKYLEVNIPGNVGVKSVDWWLSIYRLKKKIYIDHYLYWLFQALGGVYIKVGEHFKPVTVTSIIHIVQPVTGEEHVFKTESSRNLFCFVYFYKISYLLFIYQSLWINTDSSKQFHVAASNVRYESNKCNFQNQAYQS